ncbi:telomeric repeat-binding factor 1 [Nelusetta ayraudi]|uniref:telomeric repeat-binding factor 1 n=1 Tax=Nelusetta ayraudi TaxID=303726 RepID=UPI003F7154DB
MEPEFKCGDAVDGADMDEGVSFYQVSTVVTRWNVDFLFVSLCRCFKEGKLDEFDQTLSAFEVFSQSPALKGELYSKKILIVAFLTRVLRGKQMDVQYDEDSSVMPLMSAAKLWLDLKSTVADDKLSDDITVLLLVQAVAVCLEKGDSVLARSALKWLRKEQLFPEGLSVKLTTVVKKGDTYHPLLMSFSFSRLLEAVQSYVDAYLQRNPSDYLIKAATDMLKSSENSEALESSSMHDSLLSEPDNTSTQKTEEKVEKQCSRAKHKLLSTTIQEFWRRESRSHKKLCVPLRRLPQNVKKSPMEASENKSGFIKRERKRQRWTLELDEYLKEGVSQHGVGKWSRILLDYDFEGRTGTMLKDRWRTMSKACSAS